MSAPRTWTDADAKALDAARARENAALATLVLLEQASAAARHADAPKTLARIRLALSSAKGAARNATNRAARLESLWNQAARS